MEYWAAGRLLAHGGNPYSPEELLALQQPAGWTDAVPVIMWNPPWSLPLTLPFGLFDYSTGQFLWLLFHVALILISAQQLWCIYANSAQSSRLPWVLAVTYVPTVFVLIIGQISPVILAGLTAFLYFLRKQKWFGAGAAVAVLSVKPHLLYLFWIVLALWSWRNRQWRVVSGALIVGLSAALLPLLFDPQVYLEYFALYKIPDIPRPPDWLTPTLRTATRVFIGSGHTWLELIPTLAGAVWVLSHWHRCKDRWDWSAQLPLVVLVSVVTSFFAWTYDQVVFFPALIEAAIWIRRQSAAWHRFWAVRVYIAINACHALLRVWVADELWYFWLAPALLLNYLIFSWEKQRAGANARRSAV